MSIKPIPEERLKESQAELKKKFLNDKAPQMVNTEQAKQLASARGFEAPEGSGRHYLVPRIPYPDGIQLNQWYTEIQESQKYGDNHMVFRYEKLLGSCLDMMWRLSIPEARGERILKKLRLMRNPFRRLSEGDTAALLGFFLVRRIMPNVKFQYPASQQNQSQSTR